MTPGKERETLCGWVGWWGEGWKWLNRARGRSCLMIYTCTGDDDKLACIASYIVLSLFYLWTRQYALKNKNDRESRLKCVPHWRTCIQYSSNRQEAITSLVRFFSPNFMRVLLLLCVLIIKHVLQSYHKKKAVPYRAITRPCIHVHRKRDK